MDRTVPIQPPSDDNASATQALPGIERPLVLQVGAMLGPYRIEAFIRRDGLAASYKGYDQSLPRNVAIRVLPSNLVAGPDSHGRFQAEARAFDRLRHPNILALLGSGEEGGLTYLVTEYVEGTTLADHLGAPVPSDRVMEWLTPIASALDYAHALGVFHRHLTPASILLTQDRTPILTDFSFMNVSGQALQAGDWSATVGTVAYLAPEQVNGESVGAASDRYALAAIAFELLTGQAPFTGDTPLAVLLARVREPPPSPRSINPRLSRPVEEALLRGLAQHPAGRFPSAADFVNALSPSGASSPRWPLPLPTSPLLPLGLLAVVALSLLFVLGRALPWPRDLEGRLQRAGPPPVTLVPTPTRSRTAVSTTLTAAIQSAASVPGPTPNPTIAGATAAPALPPATIAPTVASAPPSPTPVPPEPTPGCVLLPSRPDDPAACRPVITAQAAYAMGYDGGDYFVRTTESNRDVAPPLGAITGDTYTNVVLTVDAHLVGDTANRVIVLGCRTMQPAGGKVTGYVLYIFPDLGATVLNKEVNGKLATLQGMKPSPAIKHGNDLNHVVMRCVNNTVVVSINDTEIVKATDPAPLGEGAVVIGVEKSATDNSAAEVRFSNLTLLGLP